MVNLNKRGIQVDVLCSICKNEEEAVEHAILNCELAKAVGQSGVMAQEKFWRANVIYLILISL